MTTEPNPSPSPLTGQLTTQLAAPPAAAPVVPDHPAGGSPTPMTVSAPTPNATGSPDFDFLHGRWQVHPG
jgi:hypothetical protein